MSDPSDTLDRLWEKLGLDSFVREAKTLEETVRPDWEEATLASGSRPKVPDASASETARISLTPPSLDEGAPANPRDDLLVVGVIGEGGMGRVLLARQASLGRDVAIKVPKESVRPSVLRSLVEEARVTGMLEHPGIIPVHALASDVGGRPALVMKRVDGVSWYTLIHDEADRAWETLAFSGDRIEIHVQILIQVCNAMAFAHRHGVIHRDIKPANILIGEFGEVYVADWGVATKKPEPGETRKPSLVGTPLYLAPEMVMGDATKMDERTDIYLLGATLYEVLAGRPPHPGTQLKQVLAHALAGDVLALPAGVPPELGDICKRCLEPDPENRFQTVFELRDSLAGFLRHRGSARLAEASLERLAELERALEESAPGERVYPLVSECRFGFMQALKDWTGNARAQEGLKKCIVLAVRFEVKQGNAAAARALLKELDDVPEDLGAEVVALLEATRRRSEREVALTQLERDLDPRVAQRERVRFFAVLVVGLAGSVALPNVEPTKTFFKGLGDWALTVNLVPMIVVYALALYVGRKSLLGTRLNRRVAGVIGMCLAGPLMHRVVAGLYGLPRLTVLALDLALLASVAAVAGFTIHWGFALGGVVTLLGALACAFWPEHTSLLFGLACGGALVVVASTWRRWRSELQPLLDRRAR